MFLDFNFLKISEVHLAVESTCDKFGFQLAEHILKLTRRLVGKLVIPLNGGEMLFWLSFVLVCTLIGVITFFATSVQAVAFAAVL